MRLLLPEPARPLDERAELEEAYATPAAPSLRANFVVSLDGAIELGGRSATLGAPADQALLAVLRALADVVLVGASTMRAEHYGPAKVSPEAVARRCRRGQTAIPPIAVVTATADLDPASHFFSREAWRGHVRPRPLILTCEAAPADRQARLAEVAEVILCGVETVEVGVALGELRRRGLAQVVCEGGPTLLTALVAEGLVDELCLTHAPVLAGPGHRSLLVPPKRVDAGRDGEGGRGDEVVRWKLVGLAEGDGLLFGRYQFVASGEAS